jgi:hypothetical protein
MGMLDTDKGETYASSLDASAPSLRETWTQSAIWLYDLFYPLLVLR